jgi:small subunit ribosomal protein S20
MAHSKSALKRWRQSERHRERNKPVRSAARTAVKKARAVIGEGAADAREAVEAAASVLDRAAKRRVLHPNAAARHKSRLMRALNRASAAPAAEEAAPKKAARPRAGAAKAPAKPRATRAKKGE